MSESLPEGIESAESQSEKEQKQFAKDKARQIADAGQTYAYILDVWSSRHNGDLPLGKAFLFSLGSQSVANSRGIHVCAIGKGGYGKSDGTKNMGKLVHPMFWKNGGVTPQTLYYSGPNMPDGIVIGLEDIVWNGDLGVTIKRITTDFQEGSTRLTTVDMEGKEVRTAKRIVFWASCVDSQADEQIRDRFIMYNVASGPDRSKEIIGHMQAQDMGGQKPKDDHFETLVCHYLTFDLKQKLFHVVIPFSNRIEFNGDPRAYGMFSDMIKSSAVFSYMKREKDEEGRLIAAIDDFKNAKSLYIEIGGHDRDKYSDAEMNVLKAIVVNGGEATQAQIQEIAQLSAGRVSDILNGRGKEGHGLLHKCKDLIVEEGRPKKYRLDSSFDPTSRISIELKEPT